MIYLFDTNILVHYIRGSHVMDTVEQQYDPLGPDNESWLSAVSLGEIRAIAMKNKWGEKRTSRLDAFLSRFLISDINIQEIILRYAAIDTFSQGLHSALPSSFTARNMGKNDLWIAATTSVLGATLLTTDTDFDHLENVFLKLTKIQQLRA